MAEKGSDQKKKVAYGSNKCQMCGRKQGLVRRYNILFCRQCFRTWAPTMGFKKMN